ncbi:MAG TPA: ATP-binding protein [Thermoanaerobaculia bacterium]|jgi:signal transduction histidine kinase/ActR/RegA family two-component response regulator|nr:ATP-binding protein [Thermoanaerobaculia bacterium]
MLHNLPIRLKLMLIAVLTTGGALLLAGAALISFETRRTQQEMERDLTTLADFVARNSTAALDFRDESDAADNLRALKARKDIVAAAIYDGQGRLFARYQQRPGIRFPLRPREEGSEFQSDAFVVYRPVLLQDERIGTVYLRSSLDELAGRLRVQAMMVGLVFIVSGLAALVLSSGLQRLVSRPIRELARTARAVSERRDYSIRAEKRGGDELGRLVDAFNDMLVQIQKRDFELRRAEQERARLLVLEQKARRQAEEANRLKDDFLATLSHELRTPLNAILGWGQVLRAGKLDETSTARALETIERNARSQAKLIADLLDISRIITGKLSIDFKPVELHRIIDAALDSVGPAADAKGIQLAVFLSPLTSPVLGDADRLQQVVWNLLSNAIKFTPHGGRVEIRLREVGAEAAIKVSDTGIGIRPEFLPHVFDRFRQADSSVTRAQGGLGLGLSIVRHLTELHGGTVEVDSQGEGLGTTFTVKLPLHLEQTEQPSLERSAAAQVWGQPDLLRDLRVLVVEDEADTRELVVTALEQCGAEVEAAGSVPEALAAYDREKPDVLVSDIGFPEEDGYSLIRKVRARESGHGGNGDGVPAAALTAYARTEDRQRAFEAGFQTHLAKPVDPSELIATVARLAGRGVTSIEGRGV